MGVLDGLTSPVVVHTGAPDVAAAVSEAGGLGVLSTEYRGSTRFAADRARARAATSRPLGACVYAGGGAAADPDRFEAYALQASQFGVPAGSPHFGDAAVGAEVATLLREPLEVVQFAAGLPARSVVDDLHRAGSEVWCYVASARDGRRAVKLGADAVVARSDDVLGLLHDLRRVGVPAVATGTFTTGEEAAAAMAAGATAVQVDDGGADDVTRLA